MLKLHFNRLLKSKVSRVIFLFTLLAPVFFAAFDIYNSINTPSNFLRPFWAYIIGNDFKYKRYYYFHEVFSHLMVLLVAILPYSGSFYEDKEKRTLNGILVRESKSKYFSSGLLINFIASFSTYFVPRCIAILMYKFAFLDKFMKPGDAELYRLGSLTNHTTYYGNIGIANHPLLFLLLTSVIASIYVALFATIVYAFSMHVKRSVYIVYIVPILIHFLARAIIELSLGAAKVPSVIMFSSESVKIKPNYSFLIIYLIQLCIFLLLYIPGRLRHKDAVI